MPTVVIPWSAGCPHRERAFEWVIGRYKSQHPEWRVIVGTGGDPWVKSEAVMPAVESSPDGIVIVADADVWCDPGEAVDQVSQGAAWAMPHAAVFRLSEQASADYMAGAPFTDQMDLDHRPYRGVLGGGIVVSTRRAFLDAPLDPRFVGWGQEDVSWACALDTLAGERWRGKSPLIHLWHPPQKRMGRARGSVESWALYRRYVKANGNVAQMRALLEEFQRDDHGSADQHLHDHSPDAVGHG